MKKLRAALSIVAIMISNITVMSYLGPPQVIADLLFEEFPVQAVNYLLSGPALFFIFGSLGAPIIIRKTGPRLFLTACIILSAIGGIFGATFPNTAYMSVMVSIVGFCSGAANVAGLTMLAGLFIDEKKHASMVGIYNALMAILGAAMTAAIGFLALGGWAKGWNVYWITIPEIILCLFFLPKDSELHAASEDDEAPRDSNAAKTKHRYGRPFWVIMVEYFVWNVLYFAPFMTLVSLRVAELGLGDSSVAGIAYSLTTVGNFCFSIFFGFFYTKIRRYGIAIASIMCLVSLVLMMFASSLPMLYFTQLLAGAAFGLAFSWIFTYPNTIIDSSLVSNAAGFALAWQGLGQFATAYVSTALMGILATNGMFTPLCPVFAIGFVVLTVVDFIIGAHDTKENKARMADEGAHAPADEIAS